MMTIMMMIMMMIVMMMTITADGMIMIMTIMMMLMTILHILLFRYEKDKKRDHIAFPPVFVWRDHGNAMGIDPTTIRINHDGRSGFHMLRAHTPGGENISNLFADHVFRDPHHIVFIDTNGQGFLPVLLLLLYRYS